MVAPRETQIISRSTCDCSAPSLSVWPDRRSSRLNASHACPPQRVDTFLRTFVSGQLIQPFTNALLFKVDRYRAVGSGLLLAIVATTGKIAALVPIMLIIGRRVIPWIMHYVAHTGSWKLFRLSVLAIALGVAFAAAELLGVSFALGAFFAGMILSESALCPAHG